MHDLAPRPVTRVLTGWLDSTALLRRRPARVLNENEASDLLLEDIERFGEPSPSEYIGSARYESGPA